MSLKASNYEVFARPPPRQLLHKVDGVLGDRSWGCRRADPHRTSGQPAVHRACSDPASVVERLEHFNGIILLRSAGPPHEAYRATIWMRSVLTACNDAPRDSHVASFILLPVGAKEWGAEMAGFRSGRPPS
ncbi:hypothetical protein CO674_34570 [Rhizobium hidalgonense]|uniref:Uncharacterized protein n=1 Tax=Rhizobium hidalgonense TaxID=1538159 RepID=A0ABX4JGP1_9HYPH|nr:hypothetical protein CO648_30070 [Rhizobium phaseoli]PDS94232.1 hypothetical protein CO659_30075 [Rhizobium sp. S9]PDT19183.1 hypothetical protein CO674_34570 [Rhizobium hidalgonense]RUM11791.1 hypothetical protein EFD56_30815 [Rhizobium phaseoli]